MRYEIGSPTDEKPAPNKTARRRPMAARPSDHINEAELPNARLALIIWKTRRSLSLSFSLSPSPSLADSPAALCHFHIPANYCCRTLYFELDPPLIAHNWPLMSKVFGRSANNAHFDTHTTWTSSLSISPSLCIMSFSLFHASDRMRERERGRLGERSCKVSPATCVARCARVLNLFKAPRARAGFYTRLCF